MPDVANRCISIFSIQNPVSANNFSLIIIYYYKQITNVISKNEKFNNS